VYGEGSALGIASALQRSTPLSHDVVALERATIAVFERRRFVASLEAMPTFAAALLRELAAAGLVGG
jgi:CRP-like cAMP-binding protein